MDAVLACMGSVGNACCLADDRQDQESKDDQDEIDSRRRWEREREAEYLPPHVFLAHSFAQNRQRFRLDAGQDTSESFDSEFLSSNGYSPLSGSINNNNTNNVGDGMAISPSGPRRTGGASLRIVGPSPRPRAPSLRLSLRSPPPPSTSSLLAVATALERAAVAAKRASVARELAEQAALTALEAESAADRAMLAAQTAAGAPWATAGFPGAGADGGDGVASLAHHEPSGLRVRDGDIYGVEDALARKGSGGGSLELAEDDSGSYQDGDFGCADAVTAGVARKFEGAMATGGIPRLGGKGPIAGFFVDDAETEGVRAQGLKGRGDDGEARRAERVPWTASVEKGRITAMTPLMAPDDETESVASSSSEKSARTAAREAFTHDGDAQRYSPAAAYYLAQGSKHAKLITRGTSTTITAAASSVGFDSSDLDEQEHRVAEEVGRALRRAGTATIMICPERGSNSSDQDVGGGQGAEDQTQDGERAGGGAVRAPAALEVEVEVSGGPTKKYLVVNSPHPLELQKRNLVDSAFGGKTRFLSSASFGSGSHDAEDDADVEVLSDVSMTDSDLSALMSVSVVGSQLSKTQVDASASSGGWSPGRKAWAASVRFSQQAVVGDVGVVERRVVEVEEAARGDIAAVTSNVPLVPRVTDADTGGGGVSVRRQRKKRTPVPDTNTKPSTLTTSSIQYASSTDDVLVGSRGQNLRFIAGAVEAPASEAWSRGVQRIPWRRSEGPTRQGDGDKDVDVDGVRKKLEQGLLGRDESGSSSSGLPAQSFVRTHLRNVMLSADGSLMTIVEDGEVQHQFAMADLVGVVKDFQAETVTLASPGMTICIAFEGHASALQHFSEVLVVPPRAVAVGKKNPGDWGQRGQKAGRVGDRLEGSEDAGNPGDRGQRRQKAGRVGDRLEGGGDAGDGRDSDSSDCPIAHPQRLVPNLARSTSLTFASARPGSGFSAKRGSAEFSVTTGQNRQQHERAGGGRHGGDGARRRPDDRYRGEPADFLTAPAALSFFSPAATVGPVPLTSEEEFASGGDGNRAHHRPEERVQRERRLPAAGAAAKGLVISNGDGGTGPPRAPGTGDGDNIQRSTRSTMMIADDDGGGGDSDTDSDSDGDTVKAGVMSEFSEASAVTHDRHAIRDSSFTASSGYHYDDRGGQDNSRATPVRETKVPPHLGGAEKAPFSAESNAPPGLPEVELAESGRAKNKVASAGELFSRSPDGTALAEVKAEVAMHEGEGGWE